MSNRIKNNLKNLVGQTLNQYYSKVKPTISDLRYKQEYQNRIIECMVGEVDDNYITTPETDNPIVKLEHSKEGVVKIPSIKGKTILVDAEGNETDTPGEGCRLVSVGEDEDNKMIILSKNKNLFDGETRKGYYSNGVFKANADNLANVNPIRIKPNTSYVGSGSGNAIPRMSFYDKDMNFISYSTNACTISPSNAYYMNIHAHSATWFQIEEGTIATARVNGKHHKTEILLDEPLREINGFIQDEIVGNMLYKNVGYKVIDSSLLTNMYIEVTNGYCRITTNNNTLNDWIGKTSNNNKDVLLYREGEKIAWKWNWNDSTIEHFYASNSNKTLSIIISQDKIDTMEGSNFGEKVKKYFDKTKFEVFYNIKKIEELPNSITLQGFDDTTMYIENSIIPTVSYGYNALIPYKQELLNQQEEVETNTLDIENNIIPYLMDMEFNLMLMEDN